MPEASGEIAKALYEMNYLRAQAEQAQRQLASVTEMLEESSAVALALQEMTRAKPEKVILPVGSGVFVKASIAKEDRDKVLVDVGAKIVAEKTVEEASRLMQERQQQLTQASQNLQNDLEAIGHRLEHLNEQVNQLEARERK
jgi:prefoldin alpha subunit